MRLKIRFEFHLHIHLYRDNSKTARQDQQMNTHGTGSKRFKDIAAETVERLMPSVSRSTADNYQTAVRSFLRYAGEGVTLGQVDAQLLKNYEHSLNEQGLRLNTIGCYMGALRVLLSKMGRTDLDGCFSEVFTGRVKTDKRSISDEDIIRIRDLELPGNDFLSLSRDLFMFSIFAMGMPFVDMAFLKHSQFRDGKFEYARHKTGQRVTVTVEPCMQVIIQRYAREGAVYVFPLLTTVVAPLAYAQYLTKLNAYNKALKRLAKLAGVEGNLSSYVSRHSWASLANSLNIGMPVIAQALGHANQRHTATYIRQLDNKHLQDANRKIIEKLTR